VTFLLHSTCCVDKSDRRNTIGIFFGPRSSPSSLKPDRKFRAPRPTFHHNTSIAFEREARSRKPSTAVVSAATGKPAPKSLFVATADHNELLLTIRRHFARLILYCNPSRTLPRLTEPDYQVGGIKPLQVLFHPASSGPKDSGHRRRQEASVTFNHTHGKALTKTI
jgi:hypothetical protein